MVRVRKKRKRITKTEKNSLIRLILIAAPSYFIALSIRSILLHFLDTIVGINGQSELYSNIVLFVVGLGMLLGFYYWGDF